MQPIDYLVLKCRHLLRTSLKRSLVAIAMSLAVAIFMLSHWPKEQATTAQRSQTVHASRYT